MTYKTFNLASRVHARLGQSRRLLTVSTLLSLALLSGCSFLEPYKAPVTQGNVMNQEVVQLLQPGLTKDQVRQLLGPPMGSNPFKPNHWEYVFYSNNPKWSTQTAQHLAINFDKDDMVSDWQVSDKAVELEQDDSFLGLKWF